MKKLALAAALLLATLPVVAQDHAVSHKKISDEITISNDVKVDGNVLKAGRYRIECDHVRIVFVSLANGKKTDVPCNGPEMAAKKDVTELYMNTAPDGTLTLTKMYLRGSKLEHVFAN